MIIVEGWVRMEAGELDRLHDDAVAMIAETRKEAGCISYAYGRALEEPDVMRISEIWENQEALNAHFQSPHMATFNQALAGAKILDVSVKSYAAEPGRTLMGQE
ncbi:MAG: putative quinol monooxygenase [Pseudomonadota bacterium]